MTTVKEISEQCRCKKILDCNVEIVHSIVQLYSDVTSVSSVFVSYKIMINNSDNFRIKCLSYSKIDAILFVLFSVFTLLL